MLRADLIFDNYNKLPSHLFRIIFEKLKKLGGGARHNFFMNFGKFSTNRNALFWGVLL